MRRRMLGLAMGFALVWPGVDGCSHEPVIPAVAPRAAATLVTLPDGSTVHVELATTRAERAYGLMGRTSLAQDRGMLFVHDAPGQYPYWMYHCRIPLDIVWMDAAHRIVEMSQDTPLCTGKAWSCSSYGGNAISLYVLELAAGAAKAHGLAVGQIVRFEVAAQR